MLQFVSDESGDTTAVIVPIALLRSLEFDAAGFEDLAWWIER
jgi:hypothetical protein